MLAHILGQLGITDQTSPWYTFWSGLGSDLSEIGGLLALFGMLYRRHNCHVKGCWRIGRHPIANTTYVVCARHHPQGAPSEGDLNGK